MGPKPQAEGRTRTHGSVETPGGASMGCLGGVVAHCCSGRSSNRYRMRAIDSSLPGCIHATNNDLIIYNYYLNQYVLRNSFDCTQAYRAAIDAHANLVEGE